MERANGLDQFYSRMTAGGRVELFIDKHGRPTTSRPHVHVTHHGSGRVDVVATDSNGQHLWRTSLSSPSGNDVNNAVNSARRQL